FVTPFLVRTRRTSGTSKAPPRSEPSVSLGSLEDLHRLKGRKIKGGPAARNDGRDKDKSQHHQPEHWPGIRDSDTLPRQGIERAPSQLHQHQRDQKGDKGQQERFH